MVIEELSPGRGMQPGRARDHAVEIEQKGVEAREVDPDRVA
jgi:hypothetical protein